MGFGAGGRRSLAHVGALWCCIVAVGIDLGVDIVAGESVRLGDSSRPRPGWAWSMKCMDCRGPPWWVL